jgi:hypothetical protein
MDAAQTLTHAAELAQSEAATLAACARLARLRAALQKVAAEALVLQSRMSGVKGAELGVLRLFAMADSALAVDDMADVADDALKQ